MAPKPLPPQDFLRECFLYDRDTGTLTRRWRPRSHFATTARQNQYNGANAEKICSSKDSDGYIQISFDGQLYFAARLIWKMEMNEEPATVDHRNNILDDNRWDNLRAASNSQNSQYSRRHKDRRHDLPKGVNPHVCGGFDARIGYGGKQYYLGKFETPEEAYARYCEEARRLHGEFHRPD